MTTIMIILISLCVVLIAMNGWLFGKMRAQQLDIEKLYDNISQLTIDQGHIRRSLSEKGDAIRAIAGDVENNCQSINTLHGIVSKQSEKLEAQGENINSLNAALENLGEGMGERVEKLWNDGLQVLATWNPLDQIEGGGGK